MSLAPRCFSDNEVVFGDPRIRAGVVSLNSIVFAPERAVLRLSGTPTCLLLGYETLQTLLMLEVFVVVWVCWEFIDRLGSN